MTRDASPPPDPVLAELLEQHFASQGRSLSIAALVATVAAWLMYPSIAGRLLVLWVIAFYAVLFIRYRVVRAYASRAATQLELDARKRASVASHALGGSAWGALGAMTLVLSPGQPENVLIVFFIVTAFATFQAASPSRYGLAYYTWIGCALAPIIVVGARHEDARYHVLAVMGALYLASITFVGRRSQQVLVEWIVKRQENARLLADLVAQKEALAEANRAKTRFLAAASHDLRQPMQAIVLLVESLRERVQEPAPRRIVESINSSVVAMSALLNELLDISKFDAGTVKPRRSVFPMNTLLDRLRVSFGHTAAQKQLTLRIRPSKAVIDTDSVLLYRILVNLLNNALRYTRTGGVLVGCRRRREGLAIEVWDTGIGIPEDQYEAIFREFHQLANPQRDREQGLGLGLAIVERTARVLGLPLTLRSRVGRGSVFSLLVPYGDPAQIRDSEHTHLSPGLDGLRLLVIEDERQIRTAMTVLLEGWRCEVLAVASGPEADVALLARPLFSPDAILADYRLPGGEDGVALIGRLRQRYTGATGIVISGDIGPEMLMEAERAGCQVLHKPLRPARLRALLGSIKRRQPEPALAERARKAS